MRKRAVKLTAVLLLFLLLEKAGMRLWIHDYFHPGMLVLQADSHEKKPDHPKQHILMAGCDCLDDFFLPFAYTETISVTPVNLADGEQSETFYKSFIFSHSSPGNRHRGPPSAC